jgi:hypothetical protein
MLQPPPPQQSNYAQQMQDIICNTLNDTEEQFDLPPLHLFTEKDAVATGGSPHPCPREPT